MVLRIKYWTALIFVSGIIGFVAQSLGLASSWIGAAFGLTLFSIPAIIGAIKAYGLKRSIVGFLVLSVFAYLIEYVGLVSGFPYGQFIYSDAMGPKAFGVLPFLLPVAYVPLVLGAFALARQATGNIPFRAFITVASLVAVDLVLDPAAVAVGIWSYPGGGFWFDVPLSNYLGWIYSSLIAWLLISRVFVKKASRLMVLSPLLHIGFFVGVLAAIGNWVVVSLGTVLVVITCFFISKTTTKSDV